MIKYYLLARPETIKSLVIAGKLPENLPEWVGSREMLLFASPQHCIATTTTNLRQTYVLELLVPPVTETSLITELHQAANPAGAVAIAKQLDIQWLQRICLYSRTAENLLGKIFNNACPVSIQLTPELFPVASELASTTAKQQQFDGMVHKPLAVPSITYLKQGDLLGSRAQTLINTVNCVGVMGKGIALEFKMRFPAMFVDYEQRCKRGEVKLGVPYIYKPAVGRWIINFPTKGDWKKKSQLCDIEAGLQYMAVNVQAWGVTSLAIPPLGCGNGGLNWHDVQPLIEKYLAPLGIPIEIYCPFHQPRSSSTAQDKQQQSVTSFILPVKRKAADIVVPVGVASIFSMPPAAQQPESDAAVPKLPMEKKQRK